MKNYKISALAAISILVSACASSPNQDLNESFTDKSKNLEDKILAKSKRSHDRNKLLREKLETIQKQQFEAQPVAPIYDPLDDINVNLVVENEDLHVILKAIAAQTEMNLLIHPTIAAGAYKVTVDFRNMPASSVLKHLFNLTDLNGEVKDNFISLKPMQEEIFYMSFMESEIQSSFSAGGDVLGGAGAEGGSSGGQVKGEFTVSGTEIPNNNPYEVLDEMLSSIVGASAGGGYGDNVSGASDFSEVGELSVLGAAIRGDSQSYTLNRLTGSLFVRARPSVMRTVRKMVTDYEQALSKQVLIEAQIIEVELSDDYQYGIEWQTLRSNIAYTFNSGVESVTGVSRAFGSLDQGSPATVTIPEYSSSPSNAASIYWGDDNASAALTMIQEFGDVSVLSNPTIRSKHGLPSMISIGTSSTYISDTKVTNNNSSGATVTTQEVQTKNVFDGLMLGVVPFVSRNNDITLSVHPVQSKVNPLSLQLQKVGQDTEISLPVVQLKSIVSQLKLRDGDVVIIGGLIDQQDFVQEEEVPWFGRLPVLGNLFKKKTDSEAVKELVIIIKVTLV
ncbi:pilus (MSHA type) biogenesis protein MshL [Colwellia sp. Arc7-D]|uniref:pilus (MSHA type) biogenesis protein MshL n=1 Tax=Colwellia sp. Arc7-D TaxID=2161872 RepID=UPI0013A57656|nr:pilus (MSHA type) biogenesis protein MshL [Colwellia sp. Arc7-D]